MSLIRRNKTIPVQTQRVQDPAPLPPQIIIPGAVQLPAAQQPPTQHHTHVTNNFYITNPAAAPPPPQAPPQPPPKTEVHYHTTVQEAPRRTSSRYRRKATSYFGMLAITAGALSIAGAYVPLLAPYAERAAEVGLIAGAAGLLGSMLLGHTSKFAPTLGLLVSLAGLLLSFKYIAPPDLKNVIPQNQPTAPAPKPLPPAAVTPAPVLPSPSPAPAVISKPDLATAKATLESARASAAAKLNLDYPATKSAAEKSAADLESARQQFPPGSPQIIAAVQKRIDAEAALHELQSKISTDSNVVTAEQQVKALTKSSK